MTIPETDNIFSFATGHDWTTLKKYLLVSCKQRNQLGQTWFLKPTLSVDDACVIAERHRQNVLEQTCIAATHKRRISAVDLADGRQFIVKEFVRLPPLGLLRPDRRSWLCGNRLQGAVSYLGWHKAPSSGLIIMERVPGCCLDLRRLDCQMSNLLPKYARAGELMAMLHQLRVFHADLKPSNFVMARPDDASPDVTIIDCDDIRLPLCFGQRHILKNLAQFLGGLTYSIPREEQRLPAAIAAWNGYCSRLPHSQTLFQRRQAVLLDLAGRLYPKGRQSMQAMFRELAGEK